MLFMYLLYKIKIFVLFHYPLFATETHSRHRGGNALVPETAFV